MDISKIANKVWHELQDVGTKISTSFAKLKPAHKAPDPKPDSETPETQKNVTSHPEVLKAQNKGFLSKFFRILGSEVETKTVPTTEQSPRSKTMEQIYTASSENAFLRKLTKHPDEPFYRLSLDGRTKYTLNVDKQGRIKVQEGKEVKFIFKDIVELRNGMVRGDQSALEAAKQRVNPESIPTPIVTQPSNLSKDQEMIHKSIEQVRNRNLERADDAVGVISSQMVEGKMETVLDVKIKGRDEPDGPTVRYIINTTKLPLEVIGNGTKFEFKNLNSMIGSLISKKGATPFEK